MNGHFWTLSLLIFLPLLSGILAFTSEKIARPIALIGALVTLVITIMGGCTLLSDGDLSSQYLWIQDLGANFNLSITKGNYVLLLLTAIIFPLILVFKDAVSDNQHQFYGLLMLSMSGLMGVFLANDLLLFYFFWELALIPVYFLASLWGGEKRAKVAFKFFIYTFLGSLLMLSGIIFLYLQSNVRSFDFVNIVQVANGLSDVHQQYLFWVFFVAFAIKMPIFPLHTWQPDTYEQTATPVTIVLSAVMVKMGIYAAMKWLMPLFPTAFASAQTIVMVLSVVGIIYGSIIALTQTNIKRLIAYSSIAHIGLMALGIFANTPQANDAVVLQMFNHGINIAGMWLVVWILERKYGTLDMREMGSLATIAPALSIVFTIICFANIGLPLTNGFIGEFMLFHGIFESSHPSHIIFMVLAGLGIILGAIYTLNMLQKVLYIQRKHNVATFSLSVNEWIVFIIVVAIIIILGVYPHLILQFISK